MPVLLKSGHQILHAVLIKIPELPLGSRMASERGPVHHAEDLLKGAIRSQSVFEGEGSAGLNVAIDELLELLPGGSAHVGRNVPIGTCIKLRGPATMIIRGAGTKTRITCRNRSRGQACRRG